MLNPGACQIRRTGSAADPLRVCLDLNIYVADLLSRQRCRSGSAAQTLVEIVRRGASSLGPTQLVISWGMLNTLGHVLREQLQVDDEATTLYLDALVRYATEGPLGQAPFIVVGAQGLVPVRDVEDLHVLTTALGAPADVLVTWNFADFAQAKDCQLVLPKELAVVPRPTLTALVIATPKRMMQWLADGAITLPSPP